MATVSPKPVVLAILDGFGVAPAEKGNAITNAKTPNLDRFIKTYPAMTLIASGEAVGLRFGEQGNSEVGHLNIGAGRVYYQSLTRIDKTIADGAFASVDAFTQAFEHVKKRGSALHFVGLLSKGNVHASIDQLNALLEAAKKQKIPRVFVHAILDGRDAPFDAGQKHVAELQKQLSKLKLGEIASLSGRVFAMDRNNRWDRTEKAYRAMREGKSDATADDPLTAVKESYHRKVYDEEFAPTVITKKGAPVGPLQKGDAVIFWNFRPDRMRQLVAAYALPAFAKFDRPAPDDNFFVTMTEYAKDLPVLVAFAPEVVKYPLARVISDAGLKQLHVAETEKYAHVTFFLNGTLEAPFPHEDRIIIPSPHVESYAEKPEMSAKEITQKVVKDVEASAHDVIIINFANSDMVGHTGNMKATQKAVATIDECLGKIAKAVLEKNGVMVITADHGNAEEMTNLVTGEMDKEHSNNPVPFIVVGAQFEGQSGAVVEGVGGDLSLTPPVGVLADVAPTLLKILNIPLPKDMTGRALV